MSTGRSFLCVSSKVPVRSEKMLTMPVSFRTLTVNRKCFDRVPAGNGSRSIIFPVGSLLVLVTSNSKYVSFMQVGNSVSF